ILTGSAAQPRSGTAPNAPAANIPPVLIRNWRRSCRFDRVLSGSDGFLMDFCRCFFMTFPPRDHDPGFCPCACYLAELELIRPCNLASSKPGSVGSANGSVHGAGASQHGICRSQAEVSAAHTHDGNRIGQPGTWSGCV